MFHGVMHANARRVLAKYIPQLPEPVHMEEYGPELAEEYVYGFAVEDSMSAIPYAVIERSGRQSGPSGAPKRL